MHIVYDCHKISFKMHLSNIVIVMIKFEITTSNCMPNSKLLCWKLDSKNDHDMEYDSQILFSSVSLIYQDFQSIFRYEF